MSYQIAFKDSLSTTILENVSPEEIKPLIGGSCAGENVYHVRYIVHTKGLKKGWVGVGISTKSGKINITNMKGLKAFVEQRYGKFKEDEGLPELAEVTAIKLTGRKNADPYSKKD